MKKSGRWISSTFWVIENENCRKCNEGHPDENRSIQAFGLGIDSFFFVDSDHIPEHDFQIAQKLLFHWPMLQFQEN